MDRIAFNAIIAHNILAERRRLGLTRPELAARAGISAARLRRQEVASDSLTCDEFIRLAEALGRSPDELCSFAEGKC